MGEALSGSRRASCLLDHILRPARMCRIRPLRSELWLKWSLKSTSIRKATWNGRTVVSFMLMSAVPIEKNCHQARIPAGQGSSERAAIFDLIGELIEPVDQSRGPAQFWHSSLAPLFAIDKQLGVANRGIFFGRNPDHDLFGLDPEAISDLFVRRTLSS
jgi:hypothetical protein